MLGIDTAGRSGSVALVDETQVLASFYLRQAPPFSSHLMRLVDAVCAQVGCRISDVGGFAVSLGPGGFTSLRVGLATAQGLAMAMGKPLVGCSTFEALVAMAAGWHGIVCPVLEARRGEVYAALYGRQDTTVREIMPGMVTTPDALCTLVTERTLFLGSGVRVYRTLLAATLGYTCGMSGERCGGRTRGECGTSRPGTSASCQHGSQANAHATVYPCCRRPSPTLPRDGS